MAAINDTNTLMSIYLPEKVLARYITIVTANATKNYTVRTFAAVSLLHTLFYFLSTPKSLNRVRFFSTPYSLIPGCHLLLGYSLGHQSGIFLDFKI